MRVELHLLFEPLLPLSLLFFTFPTSLYPSYYNTNPRQRIQRSATSYSSSPSKHISSTTCFHTTQWVYSTGLPLATTAQRTSPSPTSTPGVLRLLSNLKPMPSHQTHEPTPPSPLALTPHDTTTPPHPYHRLAPPSQTAGWKPFLPLPSPSVWTPPQTRRPSQWLPPSMSLATQMTHCISQPRSLSRRPRTATTT